MARQRFIDANRDLPPADKRDTLALRLSDFIRDLDGYEKDLLENVERTDLADVTAEQMEQHLGDPATVQQLIDFLALVQGKTADVYSRSNAWRFSQELMELYPLRYVYHEDDVVYIGADKYEIVAFDENAVSLRNPEFPLFGKELSRADFEEKLKENPANDHLKVVVTEKQSVQTPSEEKPDGIKFSIGFLEHPAFYDRQFNDRYTDLSFALGNYLLGVLDEKQHRERESKDNVGWYHKTDFEITATIGGEDFHYEGRFDIGDGEGDLISHIKNFYEYSLSPNCPFVPEWKKQGEDYYREKIESLQWGRDVFVPYLEQHKALTPEDEKLLSEILSFESEWFVPAKETTAVEEMIAEAERIAAEWETEPPEERFEVILTSDAFPDPEDAYAVWDNIREEYYAADDGTVLTYPTEEEAQAGLLAIRKAVSDKEAEEWLYVERAKQNVTPAPEKNADLIGREITIDNRRYVIESVGEISGDVSMRDITFADAVGFPINRVEKVGYIRSLLGKAQEEKQPEKAVSPAPAPSEPRHNYRITEDTLGVGGAKEKFRNNMAAINLLHELELENQLATPEEQEVLSKYVGWGGLSMAFDENNAAWADEFKELYASLSPEEYRAAMESTLTAFYTPPVVIKGMYEALERLGFSEGSILEPSCGTGNFFGLLPNAMAGSKLHGVEIDPLTGKIAKQLYQKANISVALDKVRAGGVVAFITSKGTMDKASPEIRKYIAQRAELLGAIRLPDNTFRANAGTEVTSDILFLQKRDRVIDAEPDWVHLDTDENGITMNSYFVQHPEMILGEMKMESTRFGFDSACKAYQDIPLSELLHNAVQNIQGEIPEYENELDEISDGQDASIPADPNVRNFSYALVDGKVYFREDDRMTPAAASVTAENRIKGLIQIRDCVRKLIEYQTEDYPEDLIHTEQENLNRLYDSFTKQYGLINSRGNYLAFASDESYFLLCSLEVLDDEGNFKRKADMFTKRTIKPHREITSVETASEALALSIGEKARVDLPYMEQLTGKPKEEIIKDLQGVIFRIPAAEPAQYVTADEYLSGNVRAKLLTAEAAAKENPEFAVNAQALKQVIPQDLSAAEISVRLGTTWIPQEDIQRFVMELLTPSSYAESRIKVRYTPINGDWFIENKSSDYGNVKADSTYGTKRASEYLRLYPSANILVTRKQDFETGNRKKFCSRIATGNFDAVIIGHSQFEKIPMSIERQREQLERQLDDIERGIDDVQASKGEQFTVKQLMKTRKGIKAKLDKLNDTKRKDTVIDFEQLGVDRLFIDESHFYKNLYLYTKMRNVGGIAQTEAQKSSDLFMKCRYLDEITGNRGTVFATGTPISNSMVELYSVQRYLQYDTLLRNGLQHFDSWASTFGETVTALELAPEGTNYRAKTRFAKFFNLPELMLMFREVADIQTADMLKLPVPKVNYHNIKTKPSEIQSEMVASLAKRAEKVRSREVEPNVDNMLKITNDGRKLALDQRMIDPMLPDEPNSNVNACIDNVYRIWEEYANIKAAQLVFCDLSTPKNDGTFNVYDDMREELVARGIPAEQIRFIHEATTDAQKKELFAKVRSGEVRVLLGSTPKMGAGTNVQDRLIVSMAKEVSAAVFDFKHNESREASEFKSYCVAYMVSSRYGVDTRGFNFSRLPKELTETDTQALKGELGSMRDVLGEIQSEMYKSMEKNKPAKSKGQER